MANDGTKFEIIYVTIKMSLIETKLRMNFSEN